MDLIQFAVPPWEFLVRCIAVDTVMIVALRIFGKRELGQFTLYDLVLILLVANAVQPAMTGPDTSLLGGLIIIGVLVLFNWLIGRLDRYRVFHRLLVPEPRILVRDGAFVDGAFRAEGVDRDEVAMAMREHGVDDVSDVKLAVLESDGSISVVPRETRTIRTRRVARYVRHA